MAGFQNILNLVLPTGKPRKRDEHLFFFETLNSTPSSLKIKWKEKLFATLSMNSVYMPRHNNDRILINNPNLRGQISDLLE